MDINDIRIAWTVVSFLVFVGIVAWAYSRGPRERFEEAARLPFADERAPGAGATTSKETTR